MKTTTQGNEEGKTQEDVAYFLAKPKLNKKIKENKIVELPDNYGLVKIFNTKGRSEKSSALNFCPYRENAILTVECTGKRLYMLLRNGNLIYWGADITSTKKKIFGTKNLNNIPLQVKCPTQLVDIVCGREHCLGKGKNNKIYSWGTNTYGQLGLSGFPMNSYAVKDEPTEISTFNNVVISSIFARNMSSFAISEDRVIFGWGSNESGQLGKFEKADLERKFQIPTVIYDNESFQLTNDRDFVFLLDKKLRKIYSGEVEMPSKTIMESLEINKNKHLYSREHELKDEINKLKSIKDQMRQARTSMEDFKELIKDIQSLIINFEDSINTLELRSKFKQGAETSVDKINFFDVHIQFLNSKEQHMENSLKSKENYADPGIVKVKSSNSANDQIRQKKEIEEKDNRENQTKEMTETGKKDERVTRVGDLISKVNTELQFQKHIVLNDHLKYEGDIKKKETRVKKLKEYIKTFNKVIEVCENKTHQLQAKNILLEAKDTLVKIEQEIPNFHINCLKNLENLNGDQQSLNYILLKTIENLKNLEEKIINLNIDKRNDFAMKITSIFNKNITMSKENNILLFRILVTTNEYYKKIFERIISNDNPSNFNILKNKIDSVKKQMKEDLIPLEDSEEENDIGGLHSDDSDNY